MPSSKHIKLFYDATWQFLQSFPEVKKLGIGLVASKKGMKEIGWRIYTSEPAPYLPKEINGFPTEYMTASPTSLAYGEEIEDPVSPGVRIQSRASGPGTLGCFAEITDKPGQFVLISNAHVLYGPAPELGGGFGIKVGQPKVSGCLCCERNVFANNIRHSFKLEFMLSVEVDPLAGYSAGSSIHTGWESDSAIALWNKSRAITNEVGLDVGMITGTPASGLGVSAGDAVKFVGADSGLVTGTVLEFKLTARYTSTGAAIDSILFPEALEGTAEEEEGSGALVNQLLIMPDANPENDTDKAFFGVEGDSGSVVLNSSNEVIGVLAKQWDVSAGGSDLDILTTIGTLPDHVGGIGIVSPIGKVLEAMAAQDVPINIPSSLSETVPATSDMLQVPGIETESKNGFGIAQLTNPFNQQKFTEFIQQMGHPQRIEKHQKEILHLVEKKRQVTITWQRKQGPAFIHHLINRLNNPEHKIPREVKGISLNELLHSMKDVLQLYGSTPLKKDLMQHAESFIQSLEQLAFEQKTETQTLNNA